MKYDLIRSIYLEKTFVQNQTPTFRIRCALLLDEVLRFNDDLLHFVHVCLRRNPEKVSLSAYNTKRKGFCRSGNVPKPENRYRRMKEEKLSDGPLLQGVSKYEEVLDSTRRFREAIIAQGRPYTLALTCRVDRSQSIFDDVHVIPRSFEGFASELT